MNAVLGVLLSLANLPPAAHFSTLEIAETVPGYVGWHAKRVRPDIGVLTNVGVSHQRNFRNPRAMLREMLSLFKHLTGERIAVVGRCVLDMDEEAAKLLAGCEIGRVVSVGTSRADTVRLCSVEALATRTECVIEIAGVQHPMVIGHPGAHFATNAAFAIAVVHALGMDVEAALLSLRSLPAPSRRAERFRVPVEGKVIELIDDAYNASPDSVHALLDLLRARREARRKVLVLGDMLELGPEEAMLHDGLSEGVLSSGISLLVTVGPLARRVADRLDGEMETIRFDNAKEAAAALPGYLKAWDLVALKGSNGMMLHQVARAIAAGRGRRPGPDWTIEGEQAKRGA
jgi:UDP-N-acetylmuramoyl-tripeptide--D-alanyl-D-alanine ligase